MDTSAKDAGGGQANAAASESGEAIAKPRLLDQVRSILRARHYSPRTEKAYIGWIRRFIVFHGKRHPWGMGEVEVASYLSNLAVRRHVSASTQNQALSALLFMSLLDRLHGVPKLMASLMYGSGLRLLECAQLRVKDVDFDRAEILVRDGKGRKD